MEKIEYDYKTVSEAIATLKKLNEQLLNNSTFTIYPTSELINESKGKTTDEINHAYVILHNFEQSFKSLVEKTIEDLDNANIKFVEAEKQIAKNMSNVHVETN